MFSAVDPEPFNGLAGELLKFSLELFFIFISNFHIFSREIYVRDEKSI